MNPEKLKLLLTAGIRSAFPELTSREINIQIRKTGSHKNEPYTFYRNDNYVWVTLYRGCDTEHLGTIVQLLQDEQRKLKESTVEHSTFYLGGTQIFSRNSDLFRDVETLELTPITEDEKALLIAMYANDYVAWQAYCDYLEENGLTMQAMYIRHGINLHLKRIEPK